MRVLFDVNVLIALFDPGHVHHDRAHVWWEQNRASGWASCPLTQNGFVRVMSQPGYPNSVATPGGDPHPRQGGAPAGTRILAGRLVDYLQRSIPFGANSGPQASGRLVSAFIGGPKGRTPGDIRPIDSPVGGGRGQEQTPGRAVGGDDLADHRGGPIQSRRSDFRPE